MRVTVKEAVGKEVIMMNGTNLARRWGVVLGVSALMLAACGSDPGGAEAGSDGVASLGSGATAETTGGNDSGGLEAPTDQNEAFLLYDKCMAEEGFPTDTAGSTDEGMVSSSSEDESDGNEGPTEKLLGPGGIEIEGEDIERYEKADEVCRGHLANVQTGLPEFTPEQEAALADAEVKVNECLQEKGVDMKVDLTDDEGLSTNEEQDEGDDGSGAPPPDIEEMEQALEECSKVFDEYPELDDAPLPGREQ